MSEEAEQGSRCVAAVLSFNRHELLKKCLAALSDQALAPAEILVVDNGSEESPEDMLAREFPDVSLIRLPTNKGMGAGFGTCIEEAAKRDPDWVWVMDDDAEPDRLCLKNLVAASRSLPDSTIALAPTAVGARGRIQTLQRGTYSPVLMRQVPAPHRSEIERVGYVSWLGMMLQLRMLRDVAPPRPEFFCYFDDVEYSLRLASKGAIYLVADARMYHHDQTQARRSWRIPLTEYWKVFYTIRNRFLLLRAHEKSLWGRGLGCLFGIYRTMRMAVGVVVFHPPGALLRLRLLGRGLIDGFRGREGKSLDPLKWKADLRQRGLV